MQTAQELNKDFGLNGLNFQQENGLVIADIKTARAEAKVCLQGAHLMSWSPVGQSRPVVWLSSEAKVAPGKSIRGGAPVCWPWFGPHATESSFPGHGFARTVAWQLLETGLDIDGSIRLSFRLLMNDTAKVQWPAASNLNLIMIIGAKLRMELLTENTGTESFVIGEALHTYLEISDIEAVKVLGLEDMEYLDKVGEQTRRRQSGAIDFQAETDRVYVNTGATCTIEDPGLKRRLRIEKSGSNSTVVWTPWAEKAEKMGDMGPEEGWRKMVCVESGNALEDAVEVKPGACHTMIVVFSAEVF